MLINRRKFDIRVFTLVTSVNGVLKAYFYEEGYLRTSSWEFNLKHLDRREIHLTNDAVQKNTDEYGKFEAGNKLSYLDFQKYLNINYSDLNINFKRDILSQIRKLVTDSIRSVY